MSRSRLQIALAVTALVAAAGLFVWFTRAPAPVPPAAAVAAPPSMQLADSQRDAGIPVAKPEPAGAALHTDEQTLPGTWVDVAADRPDAPLVLALHGRGDTAEHFASIAGRFGHRLAFRVLEAPWPFRDGRAWFRSEPERKRPDIEADYALLAAHARHAAPRPVALLGFSQGCMVAAHFASTYPDLVRAVLCIGGDLKFALPDPPAADPRPDGAKRAVLRPAFLFVHATDDPMVPIASAKLAAQALENRGFSTEFIEHQDGHSIPEGEVERMRAWLERRLGAP